MVASELEKMKLPSILVPISSSGDRDSRSPLFEIGGTGVFVEEVNNKVLNGEVDVAVHSAKDLPSVLPLELEITGVLPREDPLDALVANSDLKSMPSGSVIGTSSIRRMHELKMARGDIKVKNLRGNLDTRINKFRKGEYDGIILARAGIRRLSVDIPYFDLNEDDFLPSPNQGIIAIVSRKDSSLNGEIRKISHEETFEILNLERRLTGSLRLGCSVPAAILCRKSGTGYRIRCRFYSRYSREFKEFTRTFTSIQELDDLALEIAEKVPSSYGFGFRES